MFKELFDMKFQWFKYDESIPKKSGLYFLNTYHDIEIVYWNKTTEMFYAFDFDSRIILALAFSNKSLVKWARMPRVPLSKLLCTGYLKFK